MIGIFNQCSMLSTKKAQYRAQRICILRQLKTRQRKVKIKLKLAHDRKIISKGTTKDATYLFAKKTDSVQSRTLKSKQLTKQYPHHYFPQESTMALFKT